MSDNSVTDPGFLFPVTFFSGFAATSKSEGKWSLAGLAQHIAAKTGPEKKKLPWLKLATFGCKKTPLVPTTDGSGRMTGGSLRHDENVLTITGIEADYDAEQVSFDEAVNRLTSAGVLGIVYTSPSHTEDNQRWRVLCPLSTPAAPDIRSKMLGRLNGLYHGIFSTESWTLSQSYYYGSIASNPSHKVEVVDGTPIDEHDDLDEIWTGKPNTDTKTGRPGAVAKANEDELLQQIVSGGSYHTASLRLLGIWARADVAFMDARRRLIDAMEGVPEGDRDSRWQMRRADIDRSLDYVYGKEARKHDGGVAEPLGRREPSGNDDCNARPSGFTDEGLALRFTDQHADTLRYVAGWGRWMEWTGTVWKTDGTLHVFDLSRAVCRLASTECNEGRVAAAVASAKTVAAVERLTKADRHHAATVEQWDADPWLLNTPGGTVDLRTGKMRRHRPEDYLTKATAVAPGGDCPLWLGFLNRITAMDLELQAYLQRMAGYALTGSIREHALFFGYGTGANGKGVTINTVSGIMGDYAAIATMETFTASQSDRHPTDLAMLRGARLVTAQETEEGRRWAESRIKAMTGGDPITARFMRQDFFTYIPCFKLLIAGNHRPALRGVDEAIRRRMNLIPFSVRIPPEERDADLPEKLVVEWPGILKWAIEGCLEWQRIGLAPPAAVTEATAEYLAAEDAPSNWLAECCIQHGTLHSSSSDLFKSWKAWAEATGEFPGSQKGFTQKLVGKGFGQRRLGDGKAGFLGVGLKAETTTDRYGDSPF